jgi:hypothetical protein
MDLKGWKLGFQFFSYCVAFIEVTSWFEVDAKFVYVYNISNATFW